MMVYKLPEEINDMEIKDKKGEKEMEAAIVDGNGTEPEHIIVVTIDGKNGQPKQVQIDRRNKEIDLDNLMYDKFTSLNEDDKKKQEGDYIYRYRYNGGGASQVLLGSGKLDTGTGSERLAHDIFVGQLAAVIATTMEHVITPDVSL